MVYSGDTRPCPALIAAGLGSRLVIHEATFEVSRGAVHATTLEVPVPLYVQAPGTTRDTPRAVCLQPRPKLIDAFLSRRTSSRDKPAPSGIQLYLKRSTAPLRCRHPTWFSLTFLSGSSTEANSNQTKTREKKLKRQLMTTNLSLSLSLSFFSLFLSSLSLSFFSLSLSRYASGPPVTDHPLLARTLLALDGLVLDLARPFPAGSATIHLWRACLTPAPSADSK
jgi:hypothetical protein